MKILVLGGVSFIGKPNYNMAPKIGGVNYKND